MIKKVITLMIGATLIGVSSCRKQLDINTNPNVAQTVTPELLLPTAQLEIASSLGVVMNNNASIWVQYWTQSASANQYRTLEQYQPTASDYDRVWQLLYSGALPDLKQMDKLAGANGQTQYQAIAKILTAYSYQLITDAWGDVPFTEALRGQPEDGGILNPRFDAQALVYDSIIKITMDGRSLISTAPSIITPTSDDLIYGGHMEYWGAFANTLLLRMYMRLSEVNPAKAQAGIAALAGDPYGFLGDAAPDAQISYSTSAGNQNPLSTESRRLGQNQIASKTSGDSLNSNNDPRRRAFYNTTGAVIGLPQGLAVAQTGVTYSLPNAGTTGASNALLTDAAGEAAATAPVKLLTTYESYFLQAEAAARGWMAGDAADLFDQGIEASFFEFEGFFAGLDITLAEPGDTSVNGNPINKTINLTAEYAYNAYVNGDTLTGAAPSYWAQFPTGGTLEQKVRHIITQKWFSMNGTQGFEAWTEWRRTGYPNFLVQSATSLIGPGRFPARFFYPDIEVSRNASFPGQKPIYDRVWWDVN